jgi:hypothetical protein
MIQYFDELLHWQAEIADAIVQLQDEIVRYENLENNLLKRREQALVHNYLGLKNDQQEVEYALHYVQIQLNEKTKELTHLQEDFEQKVDAIISHYRKHQTQESERV